ncbi:hypothetical protein EAE96_003753 [Botrytis aclada]|nr:hypothetical protein EAE96_003753 [Botrytis aclada]
MNNRNGSAVIVHDEEEHPHLTLEGDGEFDDPPIGDPALEEPIIDDPPVEVPLLQLRPQPQPQPQPQPSRYSNTITLIQVIEWIALIVMVFFLSCYFSTNTTLTRNGPPPTRTGPPPPAPAPAGS